MVFKKTINFLKKPRVAYQPLIEVLVFKDRLVENLKTYQVAYSKLRFAPVLKSNAYGHGLVLVAGILDNQNLPFLIVDSFYEALTLRQNQIKSGILVIGYSSLEQILQKPLERTVFTVISLDGLKEITAKLKSPRAFHLKVDTGMHRQGIMPDEVTRAIQLIKSNQNVVLEGLCSHLADADNEDATFTQAQIIVWNRVVREFKKDFPKIKYFHLAATSGARFLREIYANVVRLGIGLYGIAHQTLPNLRLKPTLAMKSRVTSLKEIKGGEKVGYNCTFEAENQLRIATVPAGYYEGVDRRLSSRGVFKIRDKFCPIVGRVSMNITTVDVTHLTEVKAGDSVTIISSERGDSNSVENIAKICETIPYEILVHIPAHLRRVLV